MIQRSPRPASCAVLSVLLLCIVLVPFASAAGPTPSATVPPVLQACSHARYPEAGFTCRFPENQSAIPPDGPPYPMQCLDNSSSAPDQPIASWKWEFGDGGTGTEQNPRYSYAEALPYTIRLTVNTICGSKYSNSTAGRIFISCSIPEPAFSTNVTEGFAPLAVQVTDTSRNTSPGTTTWTYWFDDTHSSSERNPAFIYTTPGTYTINQTVRKDCVHASSSRYLPAAHQIIVSAPPPFPVDANETNTTPAATQTVTGPVATPPAATSEAPVPVPSVTLGITAAPAETAQNIPMAPGTGTFSVQTQPAGAQVYIDDVLRGTSPATVRDIPAGPHTLRLEREGYQTLTVPVRITEGQADVFSTALAPGSAGIAILPVVALALIVLGMAVFGIYLYRRQKNQ